MNLRIVGWANRVQREAARDAENAHARLAETIAKVRQAEAQSGLELLPPVPTKQEKAEGQPSYFDAVYEARRAEGQAREAIDAATGVLRSEMAVRLDKVAESRAVLESAEQEKESTLEAARRHKQSVAQMVAKETAALDDKGEGFQQGCACGLAFGCLALAGYIAFTLVMIFVGRATSADSPIGVVFMTLFVAPIAISVLLQLVFSLKRMMVESELAAKLRQAQELCDSLSDKAEDAFKTKQPGLARDLEQAEKEAAQIEKALYDLVGAPEEPPAEAAKDA